MYLLTRKNVINLDLSNPSVLLKKELFGNYTTFIWKINEGQKNYNCYCATGISVISYPLRSLTKANQKDSKKRSVSTVKGEDTLFVKLFQLEVSIFQRYVIKFPP